MPPCPLFVGHVMASICDFRATPERKDILVKRFKFLPREAWCTRHWLRGEGIVVVRGVSLRKA
eukprot:8778173-Ditylum_brightwellii.AAC.1